MTSAELDALQSRLRAGHFDIEEVAELMTKADRAISWLRGQRAAAKPDAANQDYRAENLALHAKLVAERTARPADDQA